MKNFLLLKNDFAVAYQVGKDKSVVWQRFANDSGARAELDRYLTAHRNRSFTVLLDMEEEEIHRKSMVKPGLRDRPALLKALVHRTVPEAQFHTALADWKSGDSQATVTVVAIPPTPAVEQWLRVLSSAETAVNRMLSVSLLVASAEYDTAEDNAGTLLIVADSAHEVRLVGAVDGQVVVSRQVRLAQGGGDVANELCTEVKQTADYIRRATGVESDTQAILISAGQIPEFEALSGSVETIAGISSLQLRIGCGLSGIANCPGAIYLDQVLQRRSKNADLSQRVHRQYQIARRLGHSLYAASICFVVTGIVSIAAAAYIQTDLQQLHGTTTESLDAVHRTYREMPPDYDGYPVDVARDALQSVGVIKSRTEYTPLHFMDFLAEQLLTVPRVSFDRVSWTHNSAQADDVHRLSGKGANPADADQISRRFNATIAGVVTVENGDKADALRVFDRFVALLREHLSVDSLVILQAPFGIGARTRNDTEIDEHNVFLLELSASHGYLDQQQN